MELTGFRVWCVDINNLEFVSCTLRSNITIVTVVYINNFCVKSRPTLYCYLIRVFVTL